jgi:predicted ATPase/DNA-binding CsgD family transcriptional regulator
MEDVPVLKHFDTSANNLPLQVDRFIGRQGEMAEVKALLASSRLLTLTGAGGSGKTRLALQVAIDLLKEFEQGVWWVELAALTDPLLVPQVVASALGVSEQSGRSLTDTLSNSLRSKKLLLVLDNCEHLVSACAQLAETLLHACPDLRMLATSREALNSAGETAWLVPSLRVPYTYHLPPIEELVKYEAVQLFIERAAAVLPSFRLTPENARPVVQICRRLDGIPLATELAAARVKVLSVEQLAARLDDSYRLLTGGRRTALPRQQTLRATMDWSYGLLSEKEQTLFRRLSVFRGGFTLEAAEAICAGEGIEKDEILELLSYLVDKSLAMVHERRHETRYRLLETIRQYGQDKLQERGEVVTVREGHRDWFLGLAEQAEPELLGSQQLAWFDRLEVEYDNLRAALSWSLDRGEAEIAARIGVAIWHFWLVRGYLSEGRRWLERALAGISGRSAVRAQALHAAGVLARHQDNYARATILLEESLELRRALGDKEGTGYALYSLGMLAHNRGDYERATTFSEESLLLFREVGNKRGMALVLSGLGLTVLYQGDSERARARCEESLILFRELGDTRSTAGSLTNLGITVLQAGEDERAAALFEESLSLRQKLGDKGGSAHTLTLLGRVALDRHDLERARGCYAESLALRQEIGDKEGIAAALEGLAGVAGVQGQPISAARLYGATAALRDTIGAPLPPPDRAHYERTMAAVRTQLDEPTFTAAWAEGRTMSPEQAIAAAEQVKVLGQLPPTQEPPTVGVPPTLPHVPASQGNPFGLTAREVDVLRLVTLGLTYAQIAEQLVVSTRTVDAHLRSIYSKLGVTSRSAATRYAIEHKLV